jgi:hypothetical protein
MAGVPGSSPLSVTNAAAKAASFKADIANENARLLNRVQSSSPSIESKTVNTAVNVDPAKTTASNANVEKNILHKFRSFNYNFTLAGLPKSKLADPTSYRGTSELDLVILKSGGKGNKKFKNTEGDATAGQIIDQFNKEAPGRFDMFIDNVQLTNTFSFSNRSSTTLLTNISFDVFEPYSINGFLEALQTAALASGYVSYVQASFLLKMQFTGYPDGPGMPNVVQEINGGTRYIVIQFSKVDVEVTEQGTRYRCEAIPFEHKGYSATTNQLAKSIQLQGKSVKDILENFMKGVEAQVAESNQDSKTSNGNLHDSYEVKFPTYDPVKGFDYSQENKIAKSDVAVSLEDNRIYKFEDPQQTVIKNAYKIQKPTQSATTSTTTVQNAAEFNDKGDAVVVFQSQQAIHECIAAIVRDSVYVRDLLKNIGKADDNPDQFGMVKYFLVRLEVIPKAEMDMSKKRPYQTYRYIVSEYKVHYTSIPNYGSAITDVTKYTSKAVRKYDYLYTGNNVDVMHFKLNFDLAYFESIPYAQGNNDRPSSQTAAKPAGATDIKQKEPERTVVEQSQVPVAPKAVAPSYTNSNATGGTGGQQQRDDPYWNMARAMHDSIINSKANLLAGQIEILGDPVFLVAGGTGNYAPKPSQTKLGQTDDGEVAHLEGEVLININFRNPVDVKNLANGGTAQFSKLAPFSGYYRVTVVTSTFKDGVFKQVLDMYRMPGQIDSTSPATIVATDVESVVETTPKPGDSVQADSTNATDSPPPGTSVSQFLLADATSKLPGAPGLKIGSITGLAGGLTGSAASLASGLRLSASGLKLGSTDLSVSSSPYSLSVPSVSGLTSSVTGSLNSAVAAGTAAAQGLTSSLSSAAATAQNLTGNLTGNLTSALGSAKGLASSLTGKLNNTLATGSILSADAIAAASQGLDLTSFPKSALANIPAMQPFAVASDALPDPAMVATAASNFTVPIASDISKIGNTVAQKFGSIANATSPLSKLITPKG